MTTRARSALLIVLFLTAACAIGLSVARRPRLSAAARGARLAERTGCFACHGPGGIRGTSNPGRTDGSVPTFQGDLMMYASGPDEIRAWIRDGVTAGRARSESWREQRDRGVLVMPAFGDRLSEDGIEDLVQFVLAVNGEPAPSDPLAAHGRERAAELGCFGCHGPGGRSGAANPGSFKGTVPAWDSDDFQDLVHDRAEFDEWVREGISRRFAGNPPARFFLERAVLEMPAYGDRLQEGDLDALWAYVRALRSAPTRPRASPASR